MKSSKYHPLSKKDETIPFEDQNENLKESPCKEDEDCHNVQSESIESSYDNNYDQRKKEDINIPDIHTNESYSKSHNDINKTNQQDDETANSITTKNVQQAPTDPSIEKLERKVQKLNESIEDLRFKFKCCILFFIIFIIFNATMNLLLYNMHR